VPALMRKPKTPQQMGAAASTSGRPSGAQGGVQGVNVIILVLVAVSVVIAATLLAETVNTARSIDKKAQSIRTTGIGINESTDAISQLVRTTAIARSILATAKPLQPGLALIVKRAQSINASAASIDSLASTILSTAGTINTSAVTINGTATPINNTASEINTTAKQIDDVANTIESTAGQINATAKSINATVGPGSGILGIARIIDQDAAAIVSRLNTTVATAKSIKVDSGNILQQAEAAIDTAACIDNKLPGANAAPSNCQGKP